MKKSPSVPVLGAILFIICIVIAASVSLVNQITAPIIADSAESSKKTSFEDVFPNATDFKDITAEFPDRDTRISEIHEVQGPSGTLGYLYIVSTVGYADQVKNLVAIDQETQTIKSITILKHNETPGLGAKAKEPEFKNQFNGLPINQEVTIIKGPGNIETSEVQAITASTITSDAVALGINLVLADYTKIFGN